MDVNDLEILVKQLLKRVEKIENDREAEAHEIALAIE